MGIRITADQHEQPVIDAFINSSVEITLDPDTSKFAGKIETSVVSDKNTSIAVFNRSSVTVYFNGNEIPPHSSKRVSVSVGRTYRAYAYGDYITVGGLSFNGFLKKEAA